jgi:hypothetical protein
MNTDEMDTAVLDVLRSSMDGVTMNTPVGDIVSAGRSRRRRRSLISSATGAATIAALAVAAVPALTHSAGPSTSALGTGAGSVQVHTVAFTVDSRDDGTIQVTWDKHKYFQDHAGLEKALRRAGFPLLVKEGSFCLGPQDDATLSPSGVGPGVTDVMQPANTNGDTVEFVFKPSAMPAGKELFIGYLDAAQLAQTHGRPGSVERLVSTGVPLTCSTTAPPANHG